MCLREISTDRRLWAAYADGNPKSSKCVREDRRNTKTTKIKGRTGRRFDGPIYSHFITIFSRQLQFTNSLSPLCETLSLSETSKTVENHLLGEWIKPYFSDSLGV